MTIPANDPSSDSNPLDALAEEFVERYQRGERPSLTEYTERHPDLADEIRDLFPALVMLQDVQPQHNAATGSFDVVPSGPGGSVLQRVGDYRILREVGRGGMGIVYEATQESLGRHVAVKVLATAGHLDVRKRERFRREARAAARLHHTNIVPVFGVGEEQGLSYYVMQFINGQGLGEVLAELRQIRRRPGAEAPAGDRAGRASAAAVAHSLWSGQLETPEAQHTPHTPVPPGGSPAPRNEKDLPAGGNQTEPSASTASSGLRQQDRSTLADRGWRYCQSVARIGAQVAEALAYAHSQGVLHRDIKPSNLLLDTRGTVWVADFGLAKAASDDDRLTHSGDIVGTLRYMPPERFQGHSDARCDIYSLGLTLYEMLTFSPAFDDKDRNRVYEQILREEPIRPRLKNPELPRDLETIVLKAMDKDPGHRYQNAAELADDLKRFLEDRPIQARRVTRRERLWRWCRRNPAVAGLLAFVALLLLTGATAATLLAVRFAVLADNEHKATLLESAARADERRARQEVEMTLADTHTTLGLVATERNNLPEAMLWFANAARLAKDDPHRQLINQTQVRSWNNQVLAPIRAFSQPGGHLLDLSFHASGRYLLGRTVTDHCFIWDIVAEQAWALPLEPKEVTAATWSPDGQRLVLGRRSGGADVFSFPEAQLLHHLTLEGLVGTLAFSKDSRYLALASHIVRVWDLQAGGFVTPELAHPQAVAGLQFGARGDLLVTACTDRLARVFRVPASAQQNQPLFEPVRHVLVASPRGDRAGFACTPSFIDDDKGLLTVNVLNQVVWRDSRTGEPIKTIPFTAPRIATQIRSVATSPDGHYFVVAGFKGAQVWDASTGKEVGPFLPHYNTVNSAAFSPDGRSLLTGCFDRHARLWQLPTGKLRGPPLAHQMGVALVAYSPDGRFLATAQDDGLVRVWGETPGTPDDQRIAVGPALSDIKLSSDGRYLIPSGGTFYAAHVQTPRVYEVATGEPAGPPLRLSGAIMDAAFSQDGSRLATLSSHLDGKGKPAKTALRANGPGSLQIWDWRAGKEILDSLTMPSEPRSLSYSPDGQLLAVLCADGQLLWIDPTNGRTIRQALHDSGPMGRVHWLNNGLLRFSPDGKSILTWGEDFKVRVWDRNLGSLRYAPLELKHECHDVDFSTDGKLLVTAGWDNAARVWDLSTGQPAAPPLHHPDWVHRARFSKDGRFLLTAGRDNIARVWDWREGKVTAPPLRHNDEVFDAAFTPDGRWAVTVSLDGMRCWDWRSGRPVTPHLNLQMMNAWSLKITPDGRRAIVGGHTQTGFPIISLGQYLDGEELSVDNLCLMAEVISQQRVSNGGLNNLTAEEWLDRYKQFRSACPNYWTYQPDEVAWHVRQAEECATNEEWDAAVFHLARAIPARLHKNDKALADFSKSSALDPKFATVWSKRALNYVHLRQWDKAVLDYSEAIALDPKLWGAWANRGIAFVMLKQGDKGLADLSKAIELEPQLTNVWRSRGFAYKTLGQWDKALADYSKAIDLDATSPLAWSGRAETLAKLGQWDKAIIDYSKAIDLDPKSAPTWESRGHTYAKLHQLDKAIADYSKAIDLDPKFAQAWNNRGAAYAELGQLDKAFGDFNKAIGLDDKFAPAWVNRGNAYGRMRQLDKAIADHSKAIALDPKDALAWNNRGFTYAELRQWDKAIADYSKAIDHDSKHAPAWQNRGLAYKELGQWDKAVMDFSRFIALDPKRAAGWQNRGLAHMELRQWDKAIDDLSKAIELDAKSPNMWNNRGIAYTEARGKLRRLDKAIADFSKAIDLDPNLALAWSNRGITYRNLGQLNKALADLSKAVELDPKFAHAWHNRGITHGMLGQRDQALADFSKAIEADPKYLPGWNSRGLAYAGLRQWDKAIGDYSKAIELDPKNAFLWKQRGLAHQLLGDQDKALADFSKFIELDAKNALAWYGRGFVYHSLKQWDKALADYSKALDLDPRFAIVWSERGRVQANLGQWDKALADFSRAIDLNVSDTRVWHDRGSVYNHLRQWDKAIPDYAKAIELEPKKAGSYNDLAWLLATHVDPKTRDPRRVVELAKKAVELAPKEGGHYNTLGVAHYRAGDWPAAHAALEKSMGLRKGGDSFDWFFLAMVHWQLDDKDEARKVYEQAVTWMNANQPKNDELRRFRTEAAGLLGIHD